MAICIFRSVLASRFQSFYDMRSATGRQGQSDLKILMNLDRFLMAELNPGETITHDILKRFIGSIQHVSVGTRINRLSMLRQFCDYLRNFDKRTCIIGRSLLPHRTRFHPYIYSKQEVCLLMEAARRQRPAKNFITVVTSTVIGLLYSTGLRISEALKLTIEDLDLKRQVLLVRETKFKKTRWVPLSSSAVQQLKNYLRKRTKAGYSANRSTPLFINRYGKPYSTWGISRRILVLMRAIGLRGPKGQSGPRTHDLRHTFAVNRLSSWYKQKADISAKLPLLATYLGHNTLAGTQTYLQATAELLKLASNRFHENFFIPEPERDKGGRAP